MLAPNVIAPHQGQDAGEAGGGLWSALQALWQQPGALETALALVVGAAVLWALLRLRRYAIGADQRHDVTDYLLGAEQALHGDAQGAAKRLAATVAKDPANHFARFLLAKALVELGRPAAAHKELLVCEAAFGVANAATKTAMGRALLAAGEPEAAKGELEAAARLQPRRRDVWEAMAQAQLQCGDPTGAAQALQRALPLGGSAREQASLRQRLGTVASVAALAARRRGESPTALLATARAHGGEGHAAALLAGLTTSDAPMQLPPWRCAACRAPAVTRELVCAACGAATSAREAEPAFVAPLDDVAAAVAAIHASSLHVRRLVDALCRGDAAAQAAAQAELVRLGPDAVAGLCDGFAAEPAATDARVVACLRAIGESAIDGLRATLAATPLLERLAFGLLSRATNRRVQAVEALAAIGGAKAGAALFELATNESDQRLRDVLWDAHARLGGAAEEP